MRRALIAAAVLAIAPAARAVGEEKGGFPKWNERVLLEWTNRARVEPETEMTKCGTVRCAEGTCYKPQRPLYWNDLLARAARFHSVHLQTSGYFAHDTRCTLVKNLKDLYPASCPTGDKSCACEGGTLTGSTTPSARVALFGAGYAGEIIASPEDPNSAFYLWLYESSSSTTCAFSIPNGHRWLILTNNAGSVGYGVDGNSTGDFGGGGEVHKIASGSHYPKGGASVELWANWYDTAAPTAAMVNVGGKCSPMTRTRGTDTNGAWMYAASGLTGCTRYYFTFKDSSGAQIDYPSTGSLGIGDGACADWTDTRPPADAACNCTRSCGGRTCGDDGCGGSCGSCASTQTCSAGACVTTPIDAGVTPTDGALPESDGAIAPSDGGSLPSDASTVGATADAPGDFEGSCNCATPRSSSTARGWLALALAGLGVSTVARLRKSRWRARLSPRP